MAKLRGGKVLAFSSFRPETLRGRAGFCRVGKTTSGQWWFLDAANQPFWMKAVVGADAADDAERARSWGLNTTTVRWNEGGDEAGAEGLRVLVQADFVGAGAPVIRAQGVRLPDVFDGGWAAACEARAAEVAGRWAGRTEVAGIFTDDGLGWGEARVAETDHSLALAATGGSRRAGWPTLLQVCLSLEPAFAAYHAAWDYVMAQHGRDFGALTRAWGVDWANREGVRRRTVEERALETAGYVRDQDGFSREFARRYFGGTADALRRHDPDHLVLGCRFARPPGRAVLAECSYPRVDVVSWRGDATDGVAALKLYGKLDTNPLLMTGFTLGEERPRATAAATDGRGGVTRLERRLRDGRRALTTVCEHPALAGYEWARWADQEEDVPPFGKGLVHFDGREALENTELVAQANARAERRRAGKGGFVTY